MEPWRNALNVSWIINFPSPPSPLLSQAITRIHIVQKRRTRLRMQPDELFIPGRSSRGTWGFHNILLQTLPRRDAATSSLFHQVNDSTVLIVDSILLPFDGGGSEVRLNPNRKRYLSSLLPRLMFNLYRYSRQCRECCKLFNKTREPRATRQFK